MQNEQVNDHFYGIILHYYMYGGGYYVLIGGGGVGLHKFHSQPGAPPPHVGSIRPCYQLSYQSHFIVIYLQFPYPLYFNAQAKTLLEKGKL